MDDIETVSDRVIVINKGEKVYDDTLDKLNEKYQKFKFVSFIFKGEKPSRDSLGGIVKLIVSVFLFFKSFSLII